MSIRAALFDLDGVVIDTESQYSVIWKQICKEYLGDESIAEKVKGNTLVHIYEEFFYGIKEKLPEELLEPLFPPFEVEP